MEPWIIIVLALVAIGGAVWYFNKDAKSLDIDSDGDVDIDDAKKAVDNAVKGVKQAVAKLPSAAKLKAQTKAQLEELGREFGVELDKRKTKDKMIADLKSGVKAQQK
jgi:hypothetical protein|tara:strand:- start:32 stop:352 length:321 start_codon:yes stop_codon:yes gene_type:complete